MGFQLLYLENWKTFGIKVIIFPDTFTLFMHLFFWSVTSPSLLLPPCLSFEFLPSNALSLFFCLTLSLFFPFLNSSISLIPLLLSPQSHQAHTVYTRSVWTFLHSFPQSLALTLGWLLTAFYASCLHTVRSQKNSHTNQHTAHAYTHACLKTWQETELLAGPEWHAPLHQLIHALLNIGLCTGHLLHGS